MTEIGWSETEQEQRERWGGGDPTHRRFDGNVFCCPDFSCCYPDLAVEDYVREHFLASSAPMRAALLLFFRDRLQELLRAKRGLPRRPERAIEV